MYFPTCLSELNSIEIFWKVLKDKIRQSKLSNLEILTTRVIEYSEDVPVKNLQNFIQHFINVFPKCLKKNFYNIFFTVSLAKLIVKAGEI